MVATTATSRRDWSPMLRFAPRYGIISPCLVRPARRGAIRAANDNGAPRTGQDLQTDSLVDAALRLFGAHGLAAAARACDAAHEAERMGDRKSAEWWIAVCDTLDQRMARAFRRQQARAR